MGKRPQLTGQRFGKLVVHEFSYGGGGWRCVCDCGKERRLYTCQLTWGNNQSCGCESMAVVDRPREKHGLAGSPEYIIWIALKKRCLNPENKNYHQYGGRGITICDKWRDSFSAFIADVGPRPHPGLWIDRVENSKGYEPGNCAWRTPTKQQRNKRNNHLVAVRGELIPVSEAAERFATNGVTHVVFKGRISRGWEIERALSEPPHWLKKHVA